MLRLWEREQGRNAAVLSSAIVDDTVAAKATIRVSESELIAELARRTAACERLLAEQRQLLASNDCQTVLPRAILLEALTLEALDRRQTAARMFGTFVLRRGLP